MAEAAGVLALKTGQVYFAAVTGSGVRNKA